MLVRKVSAFLVSSKSKEFCAGKTKQRFVGVEGYVAFQACAQEFDEVFQKLIDGVGVAKPIIDVVADVMQQARSGSVGALGLRAGVFLPKW